MQKGFILILLQIIWIISTSSGDEAELHLHFLLGCEAVIPCQDYGQNSDSFKWFYKKNKTSKETLIFFQDKNGVSRHESGNDRRTVANNRSLIIKPFTENDEGMYWCENCYKDKCPRRRSTVITVKKEILHEIQQTFNISAGSSFEHSCPGEFNKLDLKWTFEPSNAAASKKPVSRPEIVTSNKSIHIVNVSRADAGNYTCWWQRCDKSWQKLLTINLCVITVQHNKDSSISCDVMCDVEFNNPNRTSHVKVGTTTISVDVDTNGSLNCRAEQTFDGSTTVATTQVPSTAFNQTTGVPTEAEHLMPAVYGLSVVLACLSLTALLIFCFRSRLWEACPIHLSRRGLDGRVEEEAPVVYSSIIIIKTAAKANKPVTNNDCIYSEIKT